MGSIRITKVHLVNATIQQLTLGDMHLGSEGLQQTTDGKKKVWFATESRLTVEPLSALHIQCNADH